jgi:hypothetical protein
MPTNSFARSRQAGAGVDYVVQPGDPDDQMRFWVDGEAYPRVLIDPLSGEVRIGAGLAAPSRIGAGIELAYAEITATQATAASAGGAQIDATGLIVSPTVGSRPIDVEFRGAMRSSLDANGGTIWIVEAAAGDANRAPQVGGSTGYSPGANLLFNVTYAVRLAPTPGVHTYKVQFGTQVGGTVTLFASAAAPASLRVVEA